MLRFFQLCIYEEDRAVWSVPVLLLEYGSYQVMVLFVSLMN